MQRPLGLFSPKAAVLGAANGMKSSVRNISYEVNVILGEKGGHRLSPVRDFYGGMIGVLAKIDTWGVPRPLPLGFTLFGLVLL
jgi:hypothetical protein